DVGPAGACAVLSSGRLWCWGRGDQDQLARPNEAGADLDAGSPFRGPGLASVSPVAVAQAAMSDYTTLGLSAQGQVWTWGALAGDVGIVAGRLASVRTTPTPKRLESLEKVTSLVASRWVRPPPSGPSFPPPPPPAPNAHACAIANGEVYCWGQSRAGALCTGVPDPAPAPAHAAFSRTVKAWPQQLAAADEITCARMTDGTVFCCGSNTRGRLGAGESLARSASFVKASGFTHQAVAVATTDHAVCALVVDGTVECWGSNEQGELGLPRDEADHPSAVKIAF
ncbi:MAG: hypothetical protein K0S65_5441, partial [Labilithrix sp.]|nr:hypothetical protein [Labilithrix sp.]